MSYQGIIAPLPIGKNGLLTDESPLDIPPSHLVNAKNISLQNGVIEKEPGSRKWNNVALSSGIVALLDWFPETHLQRFIAVTREGKVYRALDPETVSEITAASSSEPTTLVITRSPQLVEGGAEEPLRSKKLFLFSGNSQVQVVSGDATTRTNLSQPSADWSTSNYPRSGVVHQNRLWVFTGDHRVYVSDDDDHENFVSGGLQFQIYPGKGNGATHGYVFRGRLFVFKEPYGCYVLVDTDSDPLNWYFRELSDEFGSTGFDSMYSALNDLVLCNSDGTLTSMQAVQEFGDVDSGDVLSILKVQNYLLKQMRLDNLEDRKAIYHKKRKIAYIAYQSSGGIKNNRLLRIDYSRQRPEITVTTKDQVNCFAIRKTMRGKVPFYGSDDGFIYEMDRENRNVGGSAYTAEFTTAPTDFRYVQQAPGAASLETQDKNFNFIELEIVSTGRWPLNVEYYIDSRFGGAVQFSVLAKGPVLDDFTLDRDRLGRVRDTVVVKIPIAGKGRTFSLKCSNSGLNQNIKIATIRIGFTVANNDERSQSVGRAS